MLEVGNHVNRTNDTLTRADTADDAKNPDALTPQKAAEQAKRGTPSKSRLAAKASSPFQGEGAPAPQGVARSWGQPWTGRLRRTSSTFTPPTTCVFAVVISRLKPAISWKRSARSLRSGTHAVTVVQPSS